MFKEVSKEDMNIDVGKFNGKFSTHSSAIVLWVEFIVKLKSTIIKYEKDECM